MTVASIVSCHRLTHANKFCLSANQSILCSALLLFFVAVAARIWIHWRFGFWAIQPVFHVYDLPYYFASPRIILDMGAEGIRRGKYTDVARVSCVELSAVSSGTGAATGYIYQQFMHLIREHYLQRGENVFAPGWKHVMPYFEGHDAPCFLSVYNKPECLAYHGIGGAESTQVCLRSAVIGAITSRPLTVWFSDVGVIPAYYVDYLCVNRRHRKSGIAQTLIQTHEYYQRRGSRGAIQVSLFKREDELTGIVPLCVYSTYGVMLSSLSLGLAGSSGAALAGCSLLKITPSAHLSLYVDAIAAAKTEGRHDVVITPALTNVMGLLTSGNIFMYALVNGGRTIGVYLFRDSAVSVARDTPVLSSFCSLWCDPGVDLPTGKAHLRESKEDVETFIAGWHHVCRTIAAAEFAKARDVCVAIESIGDNTRIVSDIISGGSGSGVRSGEIIVSPTAYFLYNYIHPTIAASRCLIIN